MTFFHCESEKGCLFFFSVSNLNISVKIYKTKGHGPERFVIYRSKFEFSFKINISEYHCNSIHDVLCAEEHKDAL